MPPVMVWRALFRHRLSLYVWAALPSAAPPCGEPADASAALGGEVPLPPAGPVRKGREAPGGNASVLARRQSSNGSASSTPRCRARKLPSVVCRRETFRQHHLDRADAYRSGQRHESSEHGHVVRNRRTEAFPDRAPERQALELRLHLAARMHELGIIDAQPAGADQRQVLDAGRIGERYEDVRLLHLGVIDSLVRQDHVRTRGPAARFRPVGL